MSQQKITSPSRGSQSSLTMLDDPVHLGEGNEDFAEHGVDA
jgi:hypothetical protein